MAAPIRQPRTPSHVPQPGEENSAFTGGFNSGKPPHLGRQSLGPPPTVRSNSGGPLSPGSGLYQHSSHLQQQRVSLAGERLADARASSPRIPSSGFGNGSGGNGNGSSAGLGAGLRNVSVGSGPGGNGYLGGSGRVGGLRPQSEYIGGLASGMFGKEHQVVDNNAIDSWFQDLQQYESTLDALATASLDQAFTDELNAIEQWFRVLSENERTAALYSLLQHATTSQIRFFQKVLSQMSQSDPMSALLSPAVGSSMQREMEARLANANASVAASNSASAAAANLAAVTGMKSPITPFSGFGNTPTFPASPGFLGAENPIPADGSAGFGSPSAQLAAQRNRNRQQNRLSAPGNLHHLSGGLSDLLTGDGTEKTTRNAGYLASGHLGDLIERGSSPAGDSNASNASRSPNLGAIGSDAGLRPKSADYATLAAAAAAMTQEQGKSPFARSSSPRFGSSALGGTSTTQDSMQAQAQQAMVGLGLPAATTQAFNQHLTVSASPSFADQFSPMLSQNWASIGNTPLLPMFNGGDPIGGNHMSTADPSQLAAQLAAMSASASPAFQSSPGGRIILDDASKFRRTPSGGRPSGTESSPYMGSGNDPQGKPMYVASHNWRSPMLGSGPDTHTQQSNAALNGLGIAGGGVGLGMNMGMGFGGSPAGGVMGLPMGMDTYNSALSGLGVGLPSSMSGGGGPGNNRGGTSRQSSRNNNPRKSPMIGGFQSQQQSSGPGANGGAGSGAGVSGADDVDERILKDTANWLRVLRLHVSFELFDLVRNCSLLAMVIADSSARGLQKYTPNFADDRWQDMVLMDSDTLEGRGVAALGARKKLLRAFANVRDHYNIPHPDWYVPEAVATTGPVNAGQGKDASGSN
ncbi:hypothetical protein QFC19_001512 [Naganishia cerealis]|uniref:Uncharacterized protein n=1 Tax=Naganishia cerealis TaxID=610337 RepID=A0ACC2WGU5_9TREE|nr:hypothetical protein QFC19_001512 [Naganishia cerealis]